MTLLNQLCRDMNRKIERQKERAIIESSARPLNAEDKARLDAIKVCTVAQARCATLQAWPVQCASSQHLYHTLLVQLSALSNRPSLQNLGAFIPTERIPSTLFGIMAWGLYQGKLCVHALLACTGRNVVGFCRDQACFTFL